MTPRPGWLGLVAVVLVGAVAGCGASAPPTDTRATYEQVPHTVRPNEKPLSLPQTVEGDSTIRLIGLTTGIPSLVGSHAELPAKGQIVRIRLEVVNTGRSTLLFDSRRQLLLTAGGGAYAPDSQAMQIKRQPTTFDLGANVRVEFDLYYDVPTGATPTGLRVFGGPTFYDPTDRTGTDISLAGG
jgi:hypothetical protein